MTIDLQFKALTSRRVSRRALLSAAPAGLLLAIGVSCGNDDDQPTATSAPDRPTSTPANTEPLRLVPASPSELGAPSIPELGVSDSEWAEPIEDILALYDGLGTDATPGTFPRTIRHAMGVTTLASLPERIVVLDSSELDTLIELGLTPVGFRDWDPDLEPQYRVDALHNATAVGPFLEPDLEAIAALQPDPILSNQLRHEAIYEQLATIAPTVFGVTTGVAWKQNFALYSQSLGHEEAAHDVVLAYESRVRDLNITLPEPRPTVSVVRMMVDNVRYYQVANFSGTILLDLGFPRSESQHVNDFGLMNQSIESLGEYADADFVFVSPLGGPNQEMLSSPAWLSVQAVRDGRFKVVLDSVWMAGISYHAAHQILDEIAEVFID